MKLSLDQVKHVAKLANLNLSEEELTTYSEQLSKILGYIEQLNQVDTANIEPIYNVTAKTSVWAKDEVRPSLSQEEALQNASNSLKGMFATKGVFGEE